MPVTPDVHLMYNNPSSASFSLIIGDTNITKLKKKIGDPEMTTQTYFYG